MSVLKNYAFTICLIVGVLIGGICGLVFGEGASIVKPIGDIFLNIMFVLIVPLVFLSVSSAIYNMKQMNMVGKVITNIAFVFLISATIAAITAYTLTLFYNPLEGIDKAALMANLPKHAEIAQLSAGELFVNTFTVPDFLQLFTKSNLLPLILFSVFFGLATAFSGEQGKTVAGVLNSGMTVILRMMRIIMYAAPIGLGCYFADTVGRVGGQILNGYLNAFLLFLVLTVICYVGLNSFYVWLAGGKKALFAFWRNIITPSLTAIATSSSAACIPINIEASRKMGVPGSIAETVIPLGTNIHKDGSVMGGVIKIVFLLTIFGQDTGLSGNLFFIIGVSLLVGTVMGAIPSGGMTGELLICSVFGFSPQLAGTLMVISTIIDVPATLLNSTGNIVSSILVTRLTEGKKWTKGIALSEDDKDL
ncbi:dicarboxylate/amino acid:cation symporter [uncultured Bacteroides sp.]|uniref:dicarboxylate/amino acid:cation symporter n=1 Tax=uncultured Bacteroides sp. TaxID=162156 RepID=UPI002AA5F022|nr:dicarboxylate/amino acid:cation symporter [uncultured Bacteroides sp.]